MDAEQRGMALDYGKARAAGSLAFVLISALLGLLVKRWSYFALIWAGFAVLLQAAANALTGEALKRQLRAALRPGVQSRSDHQRRGSLYLLGNGQLRQTRGLQAREYHLEA